MLPQEIIAIKRDGGVLDKASIEAFIQGALDGSFKDYQISALLMAIVLRGMNPEETVDLTRAMLNSGERIRFPEIARTKVDKHSTGGVGDKVSLILTPLAVACGLCVPMISGRGLGHTGGTLDKLEAIPGFRTNLTNSAYKAQVRNIHQAIVSQTDQMVPADRLLYALRDVTATVESISLITASILSKKLAEGIDALVLDVKVGKGAFMQTLPQARELAHSLVSVCRLLGNPASALITRMDQPLGRCVGNAVEVAEAIACLKGQGPDDLMEVTYALGAEMLRLGGLVQSDTEARARQQAAIVDGSALTAMRSLIEAQGGNPEVLDAPEKLPQARYKRPIYPPKTAIGATIQRADADKIGQAARLLGAGRAFAGAALDLAAGITDLAKIGETLRENQALGTLHFNTESADVEAACSRLLAAYGWSNESVICKPLVVERVES
jgi:pyrimidine-nucleoside phosphorylase